MPITPYDGVFLVKATLLMADGSAHQGFVTPADTALHGLPFIGQIAPELFLPSGERIAFWLGMFGDPGMEARTLYGALQKDESSVFPIEVEVSKSLWESKRPLRVLGFFVTPDGSSVRLSR